MTEKLDNDRRLLCEAVEKAVSMKMRTPKDFDFLRDRIYSKLNILISSTTLKRIWGYLVDESTPRESSLSVLAQYLGYRDFETFCQRITDDGISASDPVLGRHLHVTEDLQAGDQIILKWDPLRVCTIKYLNDSRFQVICSEKTRLQPGDTFFCTTMIEGEPLYLDRLCQGDNQPIGYVCGKKGGITFEIIR